MFKLYGLKTTKIFDSSRAMVDYCLKTLELPSKTIIKLIANGEYHNLTLEFIQEG